MSDAVTVRVLERGSEGIFLKHSSPAQLVEAIRKLVAGEPWMSCLHRDNGRFYALQDAQDRRTFGQPFAAPDRSAGVSD